MSSTVRYPVATITLLLDAAQPESRRVFTATSMDEAEECLAEWSQTPLPAPPAGQSAPSVSYEASFGNGLAFRNRFSFGFMGADANGGLLRESLALSVRYIAGEYCPPGWSGDRYKASLERIEGATRRNAARILAECELPAVWG